MSEAQSIVRLTPAMFTAREQLLTKHSSLAAYTFRFDSGVCGLRLTSDVGALVLLPFQGQQVWSAKFNGRNLTMKSMFNQPYPTRVFLETFGGFLQHCGITGIGGPGPEDSHPLHGELPNAPYGEAHLVMGEDEEGVYLGLGGGYRHTVAFAHNYLAEPRVKLYQGSTIFKVSMTITNLKDSPQELLYLAHVNFKPVDNGRLVYSAQPTPEHVRVRASIPSHITPGPGYVEFIEELGEDPTKHHVLAPGMAYDPEAVFFIDYVADEEGWAHSMQVHPDGEADYISHRPEQLPKATRWISRTPDQDAIALVEAGTAEPEGYHAEKAKGNVLEIPPGESFRADFRIGALSPDEAEAKAQHIKSLLSA
ncbi:MAG: DUF4432 family protein [Anaerolineae bacterium]